MEFSSPETLQTFLSRWLEEHGHTVYCQVPSPAGGTIDILTQDYAIDCSLTLTHATLRTVSEIMEAQKPHFPDQKLVIAGLTPDQDWEEAYKIAEQLKSSGIEVWFVDQMPPFVSYYGQLAKQGKRGKTNSWGQSISLAGCLMALGMAAILGLSFWLAYSILDRYHFQVATSREDDQTWEQLHASVGVWDMENTLVHLEQLSKSRNRCVVKFADQFQTTLEQRGPEGFRDINPIKRALNQQDGCKLEMQEYEFSP